MNFKSIFEPNKYWHISPNATWFWRSEKDPNYTAQACAVNNAYQWTVFQGTKEVKRGSEPTMSLVLKTVFEVLAQ